MPSVWTGATTLEKQGQPALWKKLGGHVAKLERYVDHSDVEWSAFNPSICNTAIGAGLDETLVAVRSSNYVILEHGELHVSTGGPIRNRVYVANLERKPGKKLELDKWSLRNYRRVSFDNVSRETGLHVDRGIEDAKLYRRGGEWMMTGVMLERGHTPVARQVTCQLEISARKAVAVTLEKHPGALSVKPEKNWMTPMYEPAAEFDYVYGPYAVIKTGNSVDTNDNLITRLGYDEDWTLGLRGNTHLLPVGAVAAGEKGYLGIMHRLLTKRGKTWDSRRFGSVEFCHKDYHHFLTRFDESGNITAISEPFQFAGMGIEFAAGMCVVGDNLVVTFGRGDIEAWIAWMPKDKALKALRAV
jgi:hypothetical protein